MQIYAKKSQSHHQASLIACMLCALYCYCSGCPTPSEWHNRRRLQYATHNSAYFSLSLSTSPSRSNSCNCSSSKKVEKEGGEVATQTHCTFCCSNPFHCKKRRISMHVQTATHPFRKMTSPWTKLDWDRTHNLKHKSNLCWWRPINLDDDFFRNFYCFFVLSTQNER